MKKLLAGLSAALALAGCREGQPVLFAHSLEAEAIARLAWVLFLGGGAILLLVVAAVWTAIRGPSAMRRYLATPRMVIAGGVAFPAVVLTALLFLNVTLMDSAARAPSDKPGIVPITVSGEQWWWRVAYAAPGGAAFESANEIRIPVGRDIVFTLRSADVIHSFWIPSLGGKVDMVPGRDTRLRVHATRPGVFRGPCAEYCGGAHALMALQVTAIQPHEFDAWLSGEGADAAPVQSESAREGQRLFLASGCGTCHAVRGTPAAGTIGPDLTHFASRRSIGADTLPIDRGNLLRFIAEGQKVKPGNRMPEFRIFSPGQHDALATYLLGLR
ncbi:MAG TPA: c-type cytochrome [Xanthobacteraceae bacterium]|jgi:cytochrome c oxidase subunit 2